MQQVDPNEHASVFRKFREESFDAVKYYLMFVGHARSGHSLVGALLDAHPNIVVANELHALPLFKRYNYDKLKIFKLILCRALSQRWNNTGFDYSVAGLWQGGYEKLEVIGDKKGGGSTRFTMKNPEVLDKLQKLFAASLKVVCVIRNPYDAISAQAFRKKQRIDKELIAKYFRQTDVVFRYKRKLSEDQFFTLHHEKLIADKEGEIQRLCSFLGQTASTDFLRKCGAIIYDFPNERRHEANWGRGKRSEVETLMHSWPYNLFYDHYVF